MPFRYGRMTTSRSSSPRSPSEWLLLVVDPGLIGVRFPLVSDDAVESIGGIPKEGFDLAVQFDGRSALLRVAGEIDLATAERWGSLVATMFAKDPSSITVDLGGVTFIDSTGLRLLMQLREASIDSGITMAIVHIAEPARRVITVAGVAEYLGV